MEEASTKLYHMCKKISRQKKKKQPSPTRKRREGSSLIWLQIILFLYFLPNLGRLSFGGPRKKILKPYLFSLPPPPSNPLHSTPNHFLYFPFFFHPTQNNFNQTYPNSEWTTLKGETESFKFYSMAALRFFSKGVNKKINLR